MNHLEFALHMAVAISCGIAIGAERQWRQRMAGLRTNALVAAGAALFATLGSFFTGDGSGAARVAAQIISGIGFLGGGVILREGLNVRGLNTAATLWCTAAVGTLAGCGLLVEAMGGAFIVVLSNLMLRPLAMRINRQPQEQTEVEFRYQVRVTCRSRSETQVRLTLLDAVAHESLVLCGLRSKKLEERGLVELEATLQSIGAANSSLDKLITRVGMSGQVVSTGWEAASGIGVEEPIHDREASAVSTPVFAG